MRINSFNWSKHPSGVPWMKCRTCHGRINIQEKVTQLEKPTSYGRPEDGETIITHEAEYRCKCWATKIIVEGAMQEYDLNGCFMTKVKK